MSSSPIQIPALPQEQAGAIWPTLVALADDRALRGPTMMARGASGPIVGDSVIGGRAGPSVRRTWSPTTSSPSSAPQQAAFVATAVHPSGNPLPHPTPTAPANQIVRTFTGKTSTATAGAPAPSTPPVAPGIALRKRPAATGGPPAAAPNWSRAALGVTSGGVASGGLASRASASEEGRATVALTLSIVGIVIPYLISLASHGLGNAAAFILAVVALIFAGRALSVSALSHGSRVRAGWAISLSVLVIVIWVIALTQGY